MNTAAPEKVDVQRGEEIGANIGVLSDTQRFGPQSLRISETFADSHREVTDAQVGLVENSTARSGASITESRRERSVPITL